MDKIKLEERHERRLELLDDAAHEYLKVLANDLNLPYDQEYVNELNDAAADMMYSKGIKVWYPSIKRNSDGSIRTAEFYERDKVADFNRFVTLILRDGDPDYPLGKLSVIQIRTSLSDDELIPAIKAACQDYLNTPEGRKDWEFNCNNFNYGDFDTDVPNDFCIPHGFMKLNGVSDILDLDFNEQLASLDEEDEEDEKIVNETDDIIIELPFATLYLKNEDIDDIMCTAMDGCSYWCAAAEPVGDYLGKYASEQISRGGTLIFYPVEDEKVELDLEKFKRGLCKYYSSIGAEELKKMINNGDIDPEHVEIDPGCVDADIADVILQYALFDELVYS